MLNVKNHRNASLGVPTASAVVIAAMVGSGVFTTLGFQVAEIRSTFAIMMVWLVGGVIALCGAFTYGELGAALPRSGGEYHLLRRVYTPALGFLSGWVSATVGFAGPSALAAMALASYTATFIPGIPENHLAAGVVLGFSLIHASSLQVGTTFQNLLTVLKVCLILGFVGAAFTVDQVQGITLWPQAGDVDLITGPAFAIALIFVAYAYTGWNAAIYVAGEIKQPSRTLPRSLLLGTLTVTALYALLNYVFLRTVPMDELAGQIEVGFLAGVQIFGEAGGQVTAAIIAGLLASTVSAYVFLGPRILMVMGEDMPALTWLSVKSQRGLPVNAFVFQTLVTLAFIYTSTFDQVMLYASILLIANSTLAVAGVYVLRINEPNLPRPYRTWGYPVTPAVFLAVNIWTLMYVLRTRTFESFVGLVILGVGLALYAAVQRLTPKNNVEVS
jgi:APA family basic amino acid/polyamine antiporter|tara:strand:+ start:1879 stop:3210 length:1332 start_codon:yes stop_codon:yes gene_type:complete